MAIGANGQRAQNLAEEDYKEECEFATILLRLALERTARDQVFKYKVAQQLLRRFVKACVVYLYYMYI